MNWDTLQKCAPVAVLLLASILLVAFQSLPRKHSTGYSVGLAPVRCSESISDRLIVLRVTNERQLFINQERQNWNGLASRLAEIYRGRMYRTLYLDADDTVAFQTVADALDIVENIRLSAAAPDTRIAVKLITPAAANAPCPQPVIIGAGQHPPR